MQTHHNLRGDRWSFSLNDANWFFGMKKILYRCSKDHQSFQRVNKKKLSFIEFEIHFLRNRIFLDIKSIWPSERKGIQAATLPSRIRLPTSNPPYCIFKYLNSAVLTKCYNNSPKYLACSLLKEDDTDEWLKID